MIDLKNSSYAKADWFEARERTPNDYGAPQVREGCPICLDPENERNHFTPRCHQVRAEKGLPPYKPEDVALKEADVINDEIY